MIGSLPSTMQEDTQVIFVPHDPDADANADATTDTIADADTTNAGTAIVDAEREHEFLSRRPPQRTYFKRLYINTFTHFKRWIHEAPFVSDSRGMKYTFDSARFHAVANATIGLIGVSPEEYAKTSLRVRVGKSVILDTPLWTIILLLRDYPRAIHGENHHIIPFQHFLCDDGPLLLGQFKDPLTIELIGPDPSSPGTAWVTFEAFILSSDEHSRTVQCAHETYLRQVVSAHISVRPGPNTFRIESEAPLEEIVLRAHSPLEDLWATPPSLRSTLAGMDFVNADNPLLRLGTPPSATNENTYILQARPHFLKGNDREMTGLIYQAGKDIEIHSDGDGEVDVFLVGYNIFNNEAKWYFPERTLIVDDLPSYPLTRVSDTVFIEGYWFNLKHQRYRSPDELYPYPRPGPTPVDPAFLIRLREMTATADVVNCFGWSDCRLCNQPNGCAEYTVTKNGITFRYPEGLIHYYEAHNVAPSTEFASFVLTSPTSPSGARPSTR